MENKDLVLAESPESSETTPLVKKDVETSKKESSLTKLASELSELSLEIGDKVTSTTPVDAASVDPQDTAIQVSSNSEGDDHSEASNTDVEQSETANAGETSEPPIEPPTRPVSETESPQSSSPEPEIRRNGLWDMTMWWLLWEIFLLSIPISMTYYAVKYVRGCDDGEQLPLLLIVVALMTFLTNVGRIINNVARKFSRFDENDSFPRKIIMTGDGLSFILFVAEISYFFTVDQDLCDEDLYGYVYVLNYMVMTVFSMWVLLKCANFIRCILHLRQE